MDIKKYLQEKKEIVDKALENYLPNRTEKSGEAGFPTSLRKAIQHSLFSGGKRIRPILSVAAFEAVGGKGDKILPFACGLEMIHTYSLIHDDLPAIDNDDYRRGKPTCHKVFGEAIGILAGDGLLTKAFELMTKPSSGDLAVILDIVNEIARASGISGMVGGQVADIESEGKEVDFPTVEYIHTHKTGALILASVRTGVKLGRGDDETLKAFTRYGERIGLAFQIVDDILNVEGKAELLGKSTGSDLFKRKATYPSLLGLEESRRRATELMESAIDLLNPFGPEVEPLKEIARFIILRES
ncbi:MAG: polyprenyl synthetase family protein [Thermodesulfobacteriota bacterium]|nr:polyprenyl synthetase family protein [Thermodesulfobacteriota bacterium]